MHRAIAPKSFGMERLQCLHMNVDQLHSRLQMRIWQGLLILVLSIISTRSINYEPFNINL